MDAYEISMDKRWKDVKEFLKEDFDNIKNIDAEEIKKMGDWELEYFQYYCGMGMCDVFDRIWFLENWKINYYRTDIYNFWKNKEVGPWFLALKSFNWLEDFDSLKVHEYRFKKLELKNFKFIDLGFWNHVLINKKYYDDYNKFIEELMKIYDLDRHFFRLNITYVSKIYHSDNKEKFL